VEKIVDKKSKNVNRRINPNKGGFCISLFISTKYLISQASTKITSIKRGKVISGIEGFINNDNGSVIIGVKKMKRYKAILKFLTASQNRPAKMRREIMINIRFNENTINSLVCAFSH
jgi:hypothetical protein